MSNRVLISHESPLCLLEDSRTYNDYDYCLVHLLEKYPEYLDFFQKSKRDGRMVLLDNSIFELGESFSHDAFAKWVVRLEPDEYIVPDVLNSSEGTIEYFEKWKKDYLSITKGKKIGVIHGTTYQELVNCYRYMEDNADKIAINFSNPFFVKMGYVPFQYIDRVFEKERIWFHIATGRLSFIRSLCMDGIWNNNIPHHLLGCTLPQEFKSYDFETLNIESIDTSNPVVTGLHNISYNENGELYYKIPILLADLIESSVTEMQKKFIISNIKKFRRNVYHRPFVGVV